MNREAVDAEFVAMPDLAGASYVYTETLWPELDDEQDSLPAIERLAADLFASDGRTFEGVIKDDLGRILTPGWLDATCFGSNPSRTRVAIAGSLTHPALGLPSALDLGARHASHAGWEGPDGAFRPPLNQHAKNLYVGNLPHHRLELAELGGFVSSFDVSPDGLNVAISEYWGMEGKSISIAAFETGIRRFLTSTDSWDAPVFSPDGVWILAGTRLIEAATGRSATLPIEPGSTARWWPAGSPSSILLVHTPFDSTPRASAFDLSTGQTEELGPLDLPDPHHRSITDLMPSPNGDLALCGTQMTAPDGFPVGSGFRLSILDLSTRKIEMLDSTYRTSGNARIIPDHREFRWLKRPSAQPVSVHESILENAKPPSNSLTPENYAYMADKIMEFVHYAWRAMVGATPSDSRPQRLGAELLRRVVALQALDSHGEALRLILGHVERFLQEFGGRMLAPDVPARLAWHRFLAAWPLITRAPHSAVDWDVDHRWPEARW
jgi:hypothetical protein